MSQSANIVEQLEAHFDASVARLRAAVEHFVATGEPPPAAARKDGSFTYPELVVHYHGVEKSPHPLRSFGRLTAPGEFAVTVTRPAMFRGYLADQLDLLGDEYEVSIGVRPSAQEIPFPYVLEAGGQLPLADVSAVDLAKWFPSTELADIGDELADGLFEANPDGPRPLALFDALRTDFSLARLRHYTGTPPEHVQRFILFTNYNRYVDEFVRWAIAQLGNGSRFTGLSAAGFVTLTKDTPDLETAVGDSAWRKFQMPAWHLMADDHLGISLVNIGVGPSNAKTITDHLAVVRPEAWLMIGHCGGLRESQKIGDFVLAHAYLRDDHVLDHVLPPEIPIPPIAEVQQALAAAAMKVSGEDEKALKRRMRTGTIVTTDDRNWELHYSKSALRFSLSRAVGVDMESGTIAAQGYRFRVPYGTLLCVSDKPLHGELKLPGQANAFYERAIAEHLRMAIEACEELRRIGGKLHSRKLRAFNEPPFR